MQVYRHMDIGTAKIKPSEMQGVAHHMIDILEPTERFHIMLFQTYARRYIAQIRSRGHLPILAGGTGFYIQSVLYDVDFTKEADGGEYRAGLERLCAERGAGYLHDLLREVDPLSAEAIHPHNQKRVIRALEYHHLTGERISAHNAAQRNRESAYRFCYFALSEERERLYERIDARVDDMMREGLVDEVKKLSQMGCSRDMVSMQGLGYKEILAYLEGEISLERAVFLIKRDTRHFAKRQLTWLRRERDVIWLEKERFGGDKDRLLDYMITLMKERNLL